MVTLRRETLWPLQRLTGVPLSKQTMMARQVCMPAIRGFAGSSLSSSFLPRTGRSVQTQFGARQQSVGDGTPSFRSPAMQCFSRGFCVQPPVQNEAEMEVEGEDLDPAALQRLEEYKALMKGLTGGLTPRRSAIQAFISASETKLEVSKAVALVDKYKRLQAVFNKETGSKLLDACVRAQHFDAAIAVLRNWRQLRIQFSPGSGRRLLAAMAVAGELDMMLSAHGLLIKASPKYDDQTTQISVTRGLVKGSEKRIGDAFRELENSRLRGVKGSKSSYKLLLQAINDEMQAGGDGGLGEGGETLDGLRTKIKSMLKEDGIGSPPEDAIVKLLVFAPTQAAPPAQSEEKAAEEGGEAKAEEASKKE